MDVTEVFLRTAHNYDRDAASDEAGLSCPPEEDMAQQQFKEESDINEIVRRFGLTGTMPVNPKVPMSGDFTGVTDYQSALNAVMEAQANFLEFPAEVRKRFDNDPQMLMDFLADTGNRDEAIKLGLIVVPEKTRDAVQAIDDLAKVMTPKAS